MLDKFAAAAAAAAATPHMHACLHTNYFVRSIFYVLIKTDLELMRDAVVDHQMWYCCGVMPRLLLFACFFKIVKLCCGARWDSDPGRLPPDADIIAEHNVKRGIWSVFNRCSFLGSIPFLNIGRLHTRENPNQLESQTVAHISEQYRIQGQNHVPSAEAKHRESTIPINDYSSAHMGKRKSNRKNWKEEENEKKSQLNIRSMCIRIARRRSKSWW